MKWTDKADFDRMRREMPDKVNKAAVYALAKVGEMAVKYARDHGTYTDRTSNLRNSIGYLIVQDGHIVMNVFSGNTAPKEEGGDPEKARQIGLQYAQQVASEYPNKTVLIWVAGMEYAKYVESGHHAKNGTQVQPRDVLASSGVHIQDKADEICKEFNDYLLEKVFG